MKLLDYVRLLVHRWVGTGSDKGPQGSVVVALGPEMVQQTFSSLITDTDNVVMELTMMDKMLGIVPVGQLAVVCLLANHEAGTSPLMGDMKTLLDNISFMDDGDLNFSQLIEYASLRAKLARRKELVDSDFHGHALAKAVWIASHVKFSAFNVDWSDVSSSILVKRKAHQNGVLWTRTEVEELVVLLERVAGAKRAYDDARKPMACDGALTVHPSVFTVKTAINGSNSTMALKTPITKAPVDMKGDASSLMPALPTSIQDEAFAAVGVFRVNDVPFKNRYCLNPTCKELVNNRSIYCEKCGAFDKDVSWRCEICHCLQLWCTKTHLTVITCQQPPMMNTVNRFQCYTI
jgi:hypothetical protein